MTRPWITLAVILATGCAVPKVQLDLSPRDHKADDYEKVTTRWTRRAEAYEYFESRIFAYGTFKSWDFRQAQIARRSTSERLPSADVKRLVAAERTAVESGHTVFLAVHTHRWEWNHLEETGDKALWRIRLVNDSGDSAAPVEIERLGTRNARYTALYPYYKDFYVGYMVRFPLVSEAGKPILDASTGSFSVRISGPQAAIDMKWEVDR